jgi:hypothetical protein
MCRAGPSAAGKRPASLQGRIHGESRLARSALDLLAGWHFYYVLLTTRP